MNISVLFEKYERPPSMMDAVLATIVDGVRAIHEKHE